MVDAHCHLFTEDYEDIDKIIRNMGNNIMIVNGTNTETNKEVLALCDRYPFVYGALGIHPDEVLNYDNSDLEFIKNNILHPKIVAIGEIGLDYHYDKEHKNAQQELFIQQLKIASKYNKTAIIHARDSNNDVLEIIKKEVPNLKKVLHCYSSSYEMANEFIKYNCMLGIGGVVTFKNSKILKEVVTNIDLSYLLLETDSPYLAPEPIRGTINEPKNILIVAQKIAELKGMLLDDVIASTTNNANKQFDLK